MIACLEEIAFNNKWIDKEKLLKISKTYKNEEYGAYLMSLIENIYKCLIYLTFKRKFTFLGISFNNSFVFKSFFYSWH